MYTGILKGEVIIWRWGASCKIGISLSRSETCRSIKSGDTNRAHYFSSCSFFPVVAAESIAVLIMWQTD